MLIQGVINLKLLKKEAGKIKKNIVRIGFASVNLIGRKELSKSVFVTVTNRLDIIYDKDRFWLIYEE